MTAENSTPNTSLSTWRVALEQAGLTELAARLVESDDPYAAAAAMDLPTPEYVKFATVAEFLADPEAGMAPLVSQGITTYYAGIRTTVEGLPNFRNEEALAVDGITAFITEHIKPELYDSYNLRLAEFLVGMAVVAQLEDNGLIYLDIARGTLPPLTGGQITPEFTASNEITKDNPLGELRYSAGRQRKIIQVDAAGHTTVRQEQPGDPLPAEDEASALSTPMRAAMSEALRLLQVDPSSTSQRPNYIPGRYEFVIMQHHTQLVPIFADAQKFDETSVR